MFSVFFYHTRSFNNGHEELQIFQILLKSLVYLLEMGGKL